MNDTTAATALTAAETLRRIVLVAILYETGSIDAETYAARVGDLLVRCNFLLSHST